MCVYFIEIIKHNHEYFNVERIRNRVARDFKYLFPFFFFFFLNDSLFFITFYSAILLFLTLFFLNNDALFVVADNKITARFRRFLDIDFIFPYVFMYICVVRMYACMYKSLRIAYFLLSLLIFRIN